MSDTRAQLRDAAARGPQGTCPVCTHDLAKHPWSPVSSGVKRGVYFWCDVSMGGPSEQETVAAIPLHARDGTVKAWALVDADVYAEFAALPWYENCGYATRNPPQGSLPGPKRQTEQMHRRVLRLGRKDGGKVDHINGIGLDNRRANLRVVTHAKNLQNRRGPSARSTTGVLGVTFHKGAGRFMVRCTVEGVHHHGGYYRTLEEASAASYALRKTLGMPTDAQDAFLCDPAPKKPDPKWLDGERTRT